ncbi:hotdog fold thioesterase [Duganella sp. FT50W]|uniref:Hotdog fold thioesterase n=1 Tax=Duganella lactea TaxID=2692173 RepID=A0A6L8MCX7_9BURK|nr:PaaI family thioesterase [Duganella lactea]MYM32957.1 hotdog fold thioesterase [Duganella lactea]MYM80607.1 hotdog fold thioesterase [Duganella lactea]
MDASTFNPEYFNTFGKGTLPDFLGIVITSVKEGEIVAEFNVAKHHLAPNGFLHAGSVVTLADTACGYACFSHLPEGAQNFTTIELKSNHLGTARDGTVVATATAVHLGRTTQVWDAIVVNKATGKTIALFRCTQMVLFPK